MHPLRGGLLLQGLPLLFPVLCYIPSLLPYTGEYELRFSYAKKLFFLSLSLLAGLFACTRIPPQATAPSFTPAPFQEAVVTVSSITSHPSSLPAPTDTPSPAPTDSPSPAPTATPAPTPFSLVLMGDTQGLSYSYPEALEATGAYIAQRIESESIAAVLHAGDLVDNGFKDWQ